MIKYVSYKNDKYNGREELLENYRFLTKLEELVGQSFVPTTASDYECDLKLIYIESGDVLENIRRDYHLFQSPVYILYGLCKDAKETAISVEMELMQKKAIRIEGGLADMANQILTLESNHKMERFDQE